MNISRFLSKYDLHDSILEGLKFNGVLLELNIELCNWRQKEYTQKDPEMKMIRQEQLMDQEKQNFTIK